MNKACGSSVRAVAEVVAEVEARPQTTSVKALTPAPRVAAAKRGTVRAAVQDPASQAGERHGSLNSRAHGDFSHLTPEASAPPSSTSIASWAGTVTLPRPGRDAWPAQVWQVLRDERTGAAEFDGGPSRIKTEAVIALAAVGHRGPGQVAKGFRKYGGA